MQIGPVKSKGSSWWSNESNEEFSDLLKGHNYTAFFTRVPRCPLVFVKLIYTSDNNANDYKDICKDAIKEGRAEAIKNSEIAEQFSKWAAEIIKKAKGSFNYCNIIDLQALAFEGEPEEQRQLTFRTLRPDARTAKSEKKLQNVEFVTSMKVQQEETVVASKLSFCENSIEGNAKYVGSNCVNGNDVLYSRNDLPDDKKRVNLDQRVCKTYEEKAQKRFEGSVPKQFEGKVSGQYDYSAHGQHDERVQNQRDERVQRQYDDRVQGQCGDNKHRQCADGVQSTKMFQDEETKLCNEASRKKFETNSKRGTKVRNMIDITKYALDNALKANAKRENKLQCIAVSSSNSPAPTSYPDQEKKYKANENHNEQNDIAVMENLYSDDMLNELLEELELTNNDLPEKINKSSNLASVGDEKQHQPSTVITQDALFSLAKDSNLVLDNDPLTFNSDMDKKVSKSFEMTKNNSQSFGEYPVVDENSVSEMQQNLIIAKSPVVIENSGCELQQNGPPVASPFLAENRSCELQANLPVAESSVIPEKTVCEVQENLHVTESPVIAGNSVCKVQENLPVSVLGEVTNNDSKLFIINDINNVDEESSALSNNGESNLQIKKLDMLVTVDNSSQLEKETNNSTQKLLDGRSTGSFQSACADDSSESMFDSAAEFDIVLKEDASCQQEKSDSISCFQPPEISNADSISCSQQPEILNAENVKVDSVDFAVDHFKDGSVASSISSAVLTLSVDDNAQMVNEGNNHYQYLCADEPMVPNQQCTPFLVSHVESPSRFWVNIGSQCAESLMNSVTNELNMCCQKMTSLMRRYLNDSKPKVGDIYCTQFYDDKRFYRAKVVEIRADKLTCNSLQGLYDDEPTMKMAEVKVFYIDFGNCEWVTFDSLFPLPPKFAAIPPLAACFSLFGVQPASGNTWTQEAIRWFKDIASDCNYFLGFIVMPNSSQFLW